MRSMPRSPGRMTPASAFMFAPSPYTSPPQPCTSSTTSSICSSKRPSVFGLVIIRAATDSSQAACSASRSMLPRVVAGDLEHGEPGHVRRRRVRAVRRVGDQDLGARGVAAVAVVGAHHSSAGELALGAGRRLERHRGEAADLLRASCCSSEHQLEQPLHASPGLERVGVREARQARQRLAESGVVLHRAGAERVEAAVDTEVAMGESLVVAHDVELRELGQGEVVAKQISGSSVRGTSSSGNVTAVRPGTLFSYRVGAVMACIPGAASMSSSSEVDASWRASRGTATSASMSSACAARSPRAAVCAPSSRPRSRAREVARPPHRARPARPGWPRRRNGQLDHELLEEGPVGRLRVHRGSREARRCAPPRSGSCGSRARRPRARPARPSVARWTDAASAIRAAFVQMLLVAFSRRMCCSRVPSVST